MRYECCVRLERNLAPCMRGVSLCGADLRRYVGHLVHAAAAVPN